ncbi:uridine diphosphate-N-acetylglucosamine-binding protein YvcK [Nocardioides sp.]|uniref:gluconeogenesis factor YvcK family protein n=1 Tax=Nocardioides sp. TaxID=35761 RepID=UPI00239B1856|nr:uridine diphosphate-N-acetylglucosamine-binding protein YvcK [Nocardioides sp.]MDE0776320.1 uridine diphosphate-N-acetylglucosamine-binding protein YvcK [Nocardioides sp.]
MSGFIDSEPDDLDRAQAVVALGGGHGLHASLTALRRLVDDLTVDDLTAIVTVADNGGSSGRLRGEFNVLPPGDLRMALAALCGDDDWGDTWAKVLQHRFEGDGEMRGHVVGNLLIVGLWELLGDHVDALDWVGRLLGAKGRVLPMALTPMEITAQVRAVPGDDSATTTVRGQVEVATAEGEIVSIDLDPPDPPVSEEALAKIAEADWAFLGPGSWFSSVLPHLRVTALREAILATDARLVVVLNLEEQAGETGGFGPADHLRVLVEHAPGLQVHTVLADPSSFDAARLVELRETVASVGARLVLDDVAVADGSPRHDPRKLASAYARIMTSAGDTEHDDDGWA